MRRRLIRGGLLALVVGSVLAGLRFGCGCWAPTIVDRHPDSATDVHLYEPDLFPDWGYWLQARVPQDDCEAFLDEVYPELREDFDFDRVPEEHRVWSKWRHPDVPWWTSPPMEGSRDWWSGRDPWSFARCGDGMLHVQESTH